MNITPAKMLPPTVQFTQLETNLVCDFLRLKNCSQEMIDAFRISYGGRCEMDSDGIIGISEFEFKDQRVLFPARYPKEHSGGGTIFHLSEIKEYLFKHGAYGCDTIECC